MKAPHSKRSLVVQGFFNLERFRRPESRLAVAQARISTRRVAQAERGEGLDGGAWSPDLLPGMHPARGGDLRRVGQARASSGILTTLIPVGQLRAIGEGRRLEPGIRRTMESFFQSDFSDVRVHEGLAAMAMGALALTSGEDLYFAPEQYKPASRDGVRLLGHELTHVLQQRERRAVNPYGQGMVIVQDPALEAEADRMGRTVADEMWSSARVGLPAMARRASTGVLPASMRSEDARHTPGKGSIQRRLLVDSQSSESISMQAKIPPQVVIQRAFAAAAAPPAIHMTHGQAGGIVVNSVNVYWNQHLSTSPTGAFNPHTTTQVRRGTATSAILGSIHTYRNPGPAAPPGAPPAPVYVYVTNDGGLSGVLTQGQMAWVWDAHQTFTMARFGVNPPKPAAWPPLYP